jgi:hypothetical protein
MRVIIFLIAILVSSNVFGQKFAVKDFSQIIGIKVGNKKKEVTSILGVPATSKSSDGFTTDYYTYLGNDVISVWYNDSSGKVYSIQFYAINILGAKENGFYDYVKIMKFTDPKLELLKRNPEQLLQAMGKPSEGSGDGFYMFDDGDISAHFICYESTKPELGCRQLLVWWPYD